ncbi:MAG: LytTR family DNA-binding domain-containing protein, partial [Bacteroidota bacterium]
GYQDSLMIIAGAIIVTLCLTFIGTDHTLSELLSEPIIFKKLLLNGSIVLFSWLGVRQIILFFDHKMPWGENNQSKRWLIQLPITLFFISLIFILQLYTRTIFIPDWKLFSKTVWSVDFPLSLLFGLCFNFLYYHWWTQTQRRQLVKSSISSQQNIIPSSDGLQHISIRKGKKTILITPDEIAYAFRIDEFNYLITQKGEKHLLDISLNTLEKQLEPTHFFRLNRQLLAHRSTIQSFKVLSNRHLQVELQPQLEGNRLVNKNKAASFKKWMSKES